MTLTIKKKKISDNSDIKKILESVDKEEMVRLNVLVPLSVHSKFKAKVAKQGRLTMTDVIFKFINEYISK